MEADRITARLRAQNAKRSTAERLLGLVLEGWTPKTARAHLHGQDGMVTAYHDAQSPIELGIDSKKMAEKKSGRKRRKAQKTAFIPWYQRS